MSVNKSPVNVGFFAATSDLQHLATPSIAIRIVNGHFYALFQHIPALDPEPISKLWYSAQGVVPVVDAVLSAFRDLGPRLNRQKTRMMWLIEDMGLDAFRAEVGCWPVMAVI